MLDELLICSERGGTAFSATPVPVLLRAATPNLASPSSGRYFSLGARVHRGLSKELVVRTLVVLLRAALRDRVRPANGIGRLDYGPVGPAVEE